MDNNNDAVVQRGFSAEKVSFWVILGIIFLLPLFFFPYLAIPFQTGKGVIVFGGVIISLILFLASRLKDGTFSTPKLFLLLAGAGVLVSYFLSSALSGSPKVSFVGQSLELGTFVFMCALFLLLLIVPLVVSNRERLFYAYTAFSFSFIVVALFQVIKILFPAAITFGIFSDKTANLIGTWNDLGIYFGLALVLTLITLEFITLSKAVKALTITIFSVSLLLLIVINFSVIWWVLALFSISSLIYFTFYNNKKKVIEDLDGTIEATGGSSLPVASLIVLVVSVLFLFAGGSLGPRISNSLGISQLEVRPSWSATLEIAGSELKKDPLFGTGPNRFMSEWLLNKPDGINNTLFWNTDFNFGIGLIPTFLVTTGLVGAVAWLLFIGLFVWLGVGAVLRTYKDVFSRYMVLSSFFAALYLWIFSFLYVPGPVMWTFTFLFTGLFIAALTFEKITPVFSISFFRSPRASFVTVFCLTILLIASIAGGYFVAEKTLASYYFGKSVQGFNANGNMDEAQTLMSSALKFNANDTYFRFMSEMNLIRLSSILQKSNGASQDELRNQFQQTLGFAITTAQEATKYDKTNYQNWMQLGRVYEAVVPLKIDGAYESAKTSYAEALALNPQSPEISLILARLEIAKGNIVDAKKFVIDSIQKKNDYPDAIFLLSQIQINEGNIKDAIKSVESASLIAPNDPGVFFQLGLLRYNEKDYVGAIGAFERAISLNGSYANAKYFLGLSYSKVGRVGDAINQFKDLKVTNPDNQEVDAILRNLNAGRAPFINVAPPIDDKPEKRAEPPIKEPKKAKTVTPVNNDQ